MKARVIKEECIGCGLCAGIAPEVFVMTDDGVAEAIEGEIPVIHQNATREAAEACPVSAIEVEE
jgi:ferredoxin